MPDYTVPWNLPRPLSTDIVRGNTNDNIRLDLVDLANATNAKLSEAVATATSDSKELMEPRIQYAERLAAEPGTWLKNYVLDPAPVDAPNNYTPGRVNIIQAPGWGRAICNVVGATSVIAKTGGVSGRGVPASPGQGVAASWEIRSMPDIGMDAELIIYGNVLVDGALSNRTTLFRSGWVSIAPNATRGFSLEGVVPSGYDHVDVQFSFRRTGATFPELNDYVFFRRAMITVGSDPAFPPEATYFSGDSANSYWAGVPNASHSVTAKPRGTAVVSSGDVSLAALSHQVLLDDFTGRRGGTKRIPGKTSVSFRIDHGLANFDSKMRAKLESHGFPYALALGSREWGASENAGVTKAMVDSWVAGGLAEVWSHGPSHADADTEDKLRDYIVNSKAELEADLPSAAPIDGFMHPGAGGTGYMGFRPSDGPSKFINTLAGQIILQTYAVATGEYPGTAYRVQDGRPRVGQAYFNMDTFNAAGVMVRVNQAISEGKGIQLMIHPSLIDTGGITTADVHSVIDQIKALQDAGKVIVMSAYDQLLADSTV